MLSCLAAGPSATIERVISINLFARGLGARFRSLITPTGPALDWVYDNMIEEVGPDSDTGPQIVILATDGEPNSCDGGSSGGGRRGVGGQMPTSANYQPSIDAAKLGQRFGDLLHGNVKSNSGSDGGRSIQNVVMSRHMQGELANSLAAIRNFKQSLSIGNRAGERSLDMPK